MIPAEHRKSVTFNQNGRSRSVGKTGHVQTESTVNFARNTHTSSRLGRSTLQLGEAYLQAESQRSLSFYITYSCSSQPLRRELSFEHRQQLVSVKRLHKQAKDSEIAGSFLETSFIAAGNENGRRMLRVTQQCPQ